MFPVKQCKKKKKKGKCYAQISTKTKGQPEESRPNCEFEFLSNDTLA